jgi:hypothetical protein
MLSSTKFRSSSSEKEHPDYFSLFSDFIFSSLSSETKVDDL